MKKYLFVLMFVVLSLGINAKQKFLQVEIFPSQAEHAHGGTIVELANGDMLAAWFQGYGERWADDIRILGARLPKGETVWSEPFLMADVPDFPDINPVLFIDSQETLWLVWYTVMANQWFTSIPKYRTSVNYMQKSGPPEWNWQDVIHFRPGDFSGKGIQPDDKFAKSVEEQVISYDKYFRSTVNTEQYLQKWETFSEELIYRSRGEDLIRDGDILYDDGTRKSTKLGYPYFRRMGWQTKNKAILIDDRIIIPFYSDGLGISIMAITDNFGLNWKFSTPLVGIKNIQPTLAIKKNGSIVAYMRDGGPPPKRHHMAESKDRGLTWGPVTNSDIMNSGSGSDIITLANGNWVMAYNDTEDGRHTLAVSLSKNNGKTWRYTRHIELDLNEDIRKRNKAAYPSIIQGQDGMIHVVYSYHKYNTLPHDDDTIKYIRFTEKWLKKGDK